MNIKIKNFTQLCISLNFFWIVVACNDKHVLFFSMLHIEYQAYASYAFIFCLHYTVESFQFVRGSMFMGNQSFVRAGFKVHGNMISWIQVAQHYFFLRTLVCWDVNLLIWIILINIDSPDQCWWFHSMLHMLLFSACMLCFTCFHSLLPAELFVVLLEEKNRERHLNNISEFLRSELRPTEPMEKLVLPDVVSRCLKISVDNHANIRVTTPRIFTRFNIQVYKPGVFTNSNTCVYMYYMF